MRPIINQLGDHDFNEVTLDECVPHDHLIGAEGDGWKQVGAELAFERSGPERYLSEPRSLLLEMLDAAGRRAANARPVLGRVVAHYGTLRQMSLGGRDAGARRQPDLAAALVKRPGRWSSKVC